MAKILCTRTLSGLAPADAAAEEALRKVKMGSLLTVDVKQPRNAKMHRLYWALIGLVWENMDHERYPSADTLHEAIKFAAGIRQRVELPNGEHFYIAGSIAFNQMDQAAFDTFFNRVCDLVAKHFLPGVTDAELRREVSQMTGMAA
jgi:hypothetical protein